MSSAKGSQYEREIARLLGGWWCGDRHALWRTSGSGSHARFSNTGHGDIGVVKPEAAPFPITVECKNTKAWSWKLLLESDTRGPKLFRFWEQLQREKTPASLGLLIFKGNFTCSFVMLRRSDLILLGWKSGRSGTTLILRKPRVAVVRLDDFLAAVKPEQIRLNFAG